MTSYKQHRTGSSTAKLIYLNHAGTSWPKPVEVTQALERAMQDPPNHWGRRFYEAQEAIADFFGIDDPEQLLITPGCTSSLAAAISDASIPDGKRILTSHWEHHALHRPLLKRQSAQNPVEYIPPIRSKSRDEVQELLDLEWLERALARNDVGLIAITAACNVTGELLPYEQVIELAHQHGTMVLIDAAQIVGWQKLDLLTLDADMVAFGGHKGLQSPWGIGGLYVSQSALMECVAATCDLPSTPAATSIETNTKRSPRLDYCDVGSVDQFALAGLRAAIDVLNQLNLQTSLENARHQIQRLRDCLEQIDGVRIIGPRDAEQSMPTLAFVCSEMLSSEIAKHFKSQSLIVGSGLQCAPLAHKALGTAVNGVVRLSVGIGQADDEVDEAISRMRIALTEISDSN